MSNNNNAKITYCNQFGSKLDCKSNSCDNQICDAYTLQPMSWKKSHCVGPNNTKPCRPPLCISKEKCCVSNAHYNSKLFYLKK